jgi:hypothetical protein
MRRRYDGDRARHVRTRVRARTGAGAQEPPEAMNCRSVDSEHPGVEPDLVTLAKSLAAGLPLSAVIGKAEVVDDKVAANYTQLGIVTGRAKAQRKRITVC